MGVTTGADELRELLDERVRAILERDPGPLRARIAPDVVTFPVLPPLVARGVAPVADHLDAWFDAYSDGPRYDVRDLRVDAEGDLGFCSFVYHVTGGLAAGGDVDMWVRATLVCRRVEGTWLIVHDHESVPFDPATGQALTGLSPTPG